MKKIDNSEGLNNLVIEEGQTLTIPPRLYKYETVEIKKNSLLKINDRSSKWLIIEARVIHCDGLIEYTNFRRGVGSVGHTLESGELLEHNFIESLGGSGGNGSGNNHKQGGFGFRPNDFNGGGGGSGPYYTHNPRLNLSAINATDFRGAPSPNVSSVCFGGNGGRQSFGHGGLICLIAEKIIFGTNAKIALNGSKGVAGTDGGSGDCPLGSLGASYGGGGGGGGSAGGNGGVLIVKCSDVVNLPTVDVNPGEGGKGGKGGAQGSGGCPFRGQNGFKGDAGELGYVDWQ